MSVEFVEGTQQAQAQQPAAQPAPAQTAPPVQQVPQHFPVPAQPLYYPVQQPVPVAQPAPQPQVSKADMEALAGKVAELGLETALVKFHGAHTDAVQMMPKIVEYTRAFPDIWAIGHVAALEQAYKAVKYDELMAQTAQAQEQGAQTTNEINATKEQIAATQNSAGASPGTVENNGETDYGAQLVALSQSERIFG